MSTTPLSASSSPPSSFALLRERLAAGISGAKADFRPPSPYDRYRNDPVGFARDVLGVQLWSRQRQIVESVRDNRYTTVRSCHQSGKSFTAGGVLVPWWVCTRPGAFVVTTATTQRQVRAVLWREVNRAHRRAGLPGRMNQTEWWMHGEMVAFGQKPSDFDPTAFQGIHAEEVLVLVDEACGVPASIITAAKTLIGNDASRMLLIGNPDDPETEFARSHLPGSGYNAIRIAASDTPNFTGEPTSPIAARSLLSPLWVKERVELDGWLPDTPLYRSKIDGEFPEQSEDTLIPASWVRDAQNRWAESHVEKPSPADRLGVDVGGGGDHSVAGLLRGLRFSVLHDSQEPDTMKTAGAVAQLVERECPQARVQVDVIGIGHGLCDRLRELSHKPGRKFTVAAVNVSEKCTTDADKKRFVNKRSRFWWGLRESFHAGLVALDPQDHKLAGQLVSMKWWPDSTGRIVIESKADMKKRGLPSPDRADALMLAAADTAPQGVPMALGDSDAPSRWRR